MQLASWCVMRLLVLLGLIGAAAAPARACPKGVACLSQTPLYAVAPESGAHARPVAIRVVPIEALRLPADARAGTVSALEESLATFTPEEPEDNELPEIWKTLSSAVDSGLPRVDSERAVSMVFHPMMVKTPEANTVPGIGVAGTFR